MEPSPGKESPAAAAVAAAAVVDSKHTAIFWKASIVCRNAEEGDFGNPPQAYHARSQEAGISSEASPDLG